MKLEGKEKKELNLEENLFWQNYPIYFAWLKRLAFGMDDERRKCNGCRPRYSIFLNIPWLSNIKFAARFIHNVNSGFCSFFINNINSNAGILIFEEDLILKDFFSKTKWKIRTDSKIRCLERTKKKSFEKHVQRFKRHLSMEYSITKNKNIRILEKRKKKKR